MRRVPEALMREMLGREHFALAAQAGHDSPPRPARPLDDLFDGLLLPSDLTDRPPGVATASIGPLARR